MKSIHPASTGTMTWAVDWQSRCWAGSTSHRLHWRVSFPRVFHLLLICARAVLAQCRNPQRTRNVQWMLSTQQWPSVLARWSPSLLPVTGAGCVPPHLHHGPGFNAYIRQSCHRCSLPQEPAAPSSTASEDVPVYVMSCTYVLLQRLVTEYYLRYTLCALQAFQRRSRCSMEMEDLGTVLSAIIPFHVLFVKDGVLRMFSL